MITNPVILLFSNLLLLSQLSGNVNLPELSWQAVQNSLTTEAVITEEVVTEEDTADEPAGEVIAQNNESVVPETVVAAVAAPKRQEILSALCAEKGFEVEACWKNLEAMIIKESTGNPMAVGDQGRSYGYYQIQVKLHKVTIACARDLVCSTLWTLDNLERNGYEENQWYAIKRHNGSGPMAERYANHVLAMASKF